jgi:hypothetical protein
MARSNKRDEGGQSPKLTKRYNRDQKLVKKEAHKEKGTKKGPFTHSKGTGSLAPRPPASPGHP